MAGISAGGPFFLIIYQDKKTTSQENTQQKEASYGAKKLLSTLSEEELKTLFKKNNYLQGVLYDYVCEDANIYFDNIASIFSYTCYHAGKKQTKRSALFESDSYNRYFVRILDEGEFLESCNCLQKDYCFCEDQKTADLITRLLNKIEFYSDCANGYEDISDSRFKKLEKWMQAGLEKIKNVLARFITDNIESFTDYQHMEEEFIYQVQENNNFSDYLTDGEKVFFTVNYCKA